MSPTIDHLGIATHDLAGAIGLYEDLLGLTVVHREQFDGMDIAFLDVGNAYLELLQPVDDGPVAQFLEDAGPGIHHLAFQVETITDALRRAQEHNIRCLDTDPRSGAWGHDVAFLHPKDTDGVLIEFVEH